MFTRTGPLTKTGIKRVKCVGCGKPGHATWNVCALGRKYFHVLCKECDVALNEMAVRFLFGNTQDEALEAYRQKVLGDAGVHGTSRQVDRQSQEEPSLHL